MTSSSYWMILANVNSRSRSLYAIAVPSVCRLALILRYFNEFGSFRGALRKSGWQSYNYRQFAITMSNSKRL